LKYPDLKYESISRQKYQGDEYNGYSYSYAFITEQKKLMKAGYNMKKAFELVEEKFQDKMKRKLDQTLVSRGLAIGNRARSLLTLYQQQVEEESRLKMLRTKR
jgi:type II secretory pathway component PulF